MTRETVTPIPLTVSPDSCAPLVQATAANRFPDAALDGVGTYWLGRNSTISLFTLRFADAEQAAAEVERISSALDACVDDQMMIRRTQASSSIQAWQATVGRTETDTGADGELGYTLTGPDGLMAIELMPYLNTISWQSRWETGSSLVLDAARRPADAVPALPAGLDRRRPAEVIHQPPGGRGVRPPAS